MSKVSCFGNDDVWEINKMHWEVEQKFRVADLHSAEAALAEFGVKFGEAIVQIDQYFNHPSRDFGQTDEALRLRQVGSNNFITYKGPKVDALTKTRRELELPLADGLKSCEQFAELLATLGFHHVATAKKTRRPGHLGWEGWHVEVAVDQVDAVGAFVELEISASDTTLVEGKTALESLSGLLQLGESERRSYLELLLENRQ